MKSNAQITGTYLIKNLNTKNIRNEQKPIDSLPLDMLPQTLKTLIFHTSIVDVSKW